MMPQLLTVSEALSANHTYRYFCELASTQLDYDGIPKTFRVVRIVVAEPTQSVIENTLFSGDWLQGYSLVSYWQPEDCCFF